ncbi:sulfur carrier protein ThiS [Rhodoblastus acidophilus]|uniref:Sulfur carrier protein ThiS n=1 Tax=Candidatus Rhodoblastus alkanivorans TaxID=2954117 RepID=A0ABS9Z7U7_9HYPH|nr:sulfur carrier protein ThiS [Candidatus Rhodoblastus alkanivorans]MCI4678694.1 sulfur carrier protein ThiS [Candidatus Rhodoblastus alkanivorans]MCI4683510.1 sulfur carrier protein ThiS [Candidatus Rhodoblastus alkanivorans]MDI4640825.1 sulfur carrier protein ThiS [Rhodoblastus acidophilus]
MKIVVNGETRDVRAPDLAALLAELDFPPELVATAVNETFIRAKERRICVLAEGDRVEILTPRQGG